DMDLPAAKVDEKEHVVRHQPTQGPDLGRKEVGGDQHVHVRTDALLPCGGRLTLWRRWEARALEDMAHSLIADGVAKVGQGADDPVITPGAILLGHADD